jgi:cytochrome b561
MVEAKLRSWRWSHIFYHWVCALLILGLYLLGDFMVDLDYYDEWYKLAPFWHRSFGLLLLSLFLLRFLNILMFGKPEPIGVAKWERRVSAFVHWLFYILVLTACISGYLISSADGRGVSFFAWFDVPALFSDIDQLEEIAGDVHEYAVNSLVVLALLHGLAALKHHFLDRDDTLSRMLYRR